MGYLPSLKDWTHDYLILATVELDLPISKYLSFKTVLRQTYDSTPAQDSERNEVKVILSLAWRF